MDKVIFIEVDATGLTQTHAIIEQADGSFISMPKSRWDELEAQREQSGTL